MADGEQEKWTEEKVKMFLGKQSEVEIRVLKALEELEFPFTAMVLVEPKNYAAIKNSILTKFNVGDQYVIYISLNTSFQKLYSDFSRDNKSLDNVYFLDMISANSGAKIINLPNVEYVNSPSDLTDCIMLLEKKLDAMPNKRVIILLDSVTTVAVYNDPSVVEKFIHVLIGKASSYNVSAILLSPDYGETKSITETIEQFMDKTIKV